MVETTENKDENRDLAYRIICLLFVNILFILLLIPGIVRKIREFISKRRKIVIEYNWTVSPLVEEHYGKVQNSLLHPDIYSKELNRMIGDMLLETMVRNSTGDIQEAFPEDFNSDIPACNKLEKMRAKKKDAIQLVKASAAMEADLI